MSVEDIRMLVSGVTKKYSIRNKRYIRSSLNVTYIVEKIVKEDLDMS